VERYSRIEGVSLHSKVLTDGTDVTFHEETSSSAPLPHVTVAFPAFRHETRRRSCRLAAVELFFRME